MYIILKLENHETILYSNQKYLLYLYFISEFAKCRVAPQDLRFSNHLTTGRCLRYSSLVDTKGIQILITVNRFESN